MITKNEEDWIENCIRSVAPVICETILVDTGSTDRTVELAQALGARIFHEPWKDDFSAARNISLEHAQGDWILILDADEAIAPGDLEGLQKLTLDRTICWEFLQRHYSNDHRMSNYFPVRGEFPEMERHYAGFFESNLCRLFPHQEGIHYQGRIHELVEHSIRQIGKHEVRRTEIRIHHYGHTPEVKAKKKKSKLYNPLGVKKITDNPHDWKAYFELGVEANVSGRLEEAAQQLAKASEMNPGYVPTWTNLGYVLMQLERYEQAIEVLTTAIRLDDQSYEAFCNLGVVYMRTSRLPLAEQVLRRAIQIKSDYINAYCNLGKTIASQNRIAEAANIYKRALHLQPKCQTALADLGTLYFLAKDYEQAEKLLLEAHKLNPEDGNVCLHLGQVYRLTSRVQSALETLEKFCSLSAGQPRLATLVGNVERECEQLRSQLSL